MKGFVKSKFGQSFLSFVGFFYIQFVYKTSNFKFENKEVLEQLFSLDKPIILCCWHQRLCMLPAACKWPSKKVYMLLSPHSDGTLISKILSFFNISSIFGSTFQNQNQAALQVLRQLKKGNIVGITPDGPRGPAQRASEGISALAILSKAYILPLTYSIKRHKKLRSWDKCMVPLPFSKGLFLCGDLIDSTQFDDKEHLRQTVQNKLNELTQKADAKLLN